MTNPNDDANPREPETYVVKPAVFTPAVFVPAHPPHSADAVDAQRPAESVARPGPSPWARGVDELVGWMKTVVSAAVYATLIVTFGVQIARVDGQSMVPTLQDQDRLVANKLAYVVGSPQVGDVVMFYWPEDPDKTFVKRVVAQAGDTIRSDNGRVYRNELLLNDDFIPEEDRSYDSWGPIVVKKGYYFVLGDHRNNSSDSRSWGEVPRKYIIGKIQARWWPLDRARIF